MMAAMDPKPDLALPAVPPAPSGERIEARARGLAGLIAAQESAVIHHQSDRLTAMVIVLNGRVVDAVAQTNTEVVKGVDVLDELAEVPVADLEVIGVSPRLARALPIYWRAPGATRELVGTLVQPGRRGAVLAVSPTHGTGIVVFDERGIVASFVGGEMREEAIDELLNDPATVVSPRLEPRPGTKLPDLRPGPVEEEAAPAATAPTAPPPVEAFHQPPTPSPREAVPGAGFESPPSAGVYGGFGGAPAYPSQPGDQFGGWGPSGFAPATTPPAAPSPSSAPAPGAYGAAPDPQLEQRRQAIVELLEHELGRHAESVSTPFRTAPTVEALQGAAQALAQESVRLISPTRMQNLSLRATAIARGEQPPN